MAKSIKNAATLVVNRLPAMLRSFKKLTEMDVLVGVPRDTADRDAESSDMNNATLAYIHENGSPAANIPARPFIAPGIEDAKDDIVARLQSAARKITKTGVQDEKVWHRIGMVAQNAVRKRINDGPPPPLAASTLAARRRRGRNSTKPLVDTGQLRNSIIYVVRKK